MRDPFATLTLQDFDLKIFEKRKTIEKLFFSVLLQKRFVKAHFQVEPKRD